MQQVRGDPVQPRTRTVERRIERGPPFERDPEHLTRQIVRLSANAASQVAVDRDEMPIEHDGEPARLLEGARDHLRVGHRLDVGALALGVGVLHTSMLLAAATWFAGDRALAYNW